MVEAVLLGSLKVFGLSFPRFCHWWDGRQRVAPQEMPTASSLVVSMSIEEL